MPVRRRVASTRRPEAVRVFDVTIGAGATVATYSASHSSLPAALPPPASTVSPPPESAGSVMRQWVASIRTAGTAVPAGPEAVERTFTVAGGRSKRRTALPGSTSETTGPPDGLPSLHDRCAAVVVQPDT